MKHKNYFQVNAKDNYSLGLQLGEIFNKVIQKSLSKQSSNSKWGQKVDNSKPHLKITQQFFPKYVEELKGYAEGAGIDFEELWALSIEDDVDIDKCTTIITNNGLLMSHNEDWEAGAQDSICVLKKTINELTILELYYHSTLGGCSVSVNSNGFFQAINTLTHSDGQIGIPRNVVARWLSETKEPDGDYKKFKEIQRQLGYSHVLVNQKGEAWNIESTAKESILTKPNIPFIHTNHCLTKLTEVDTNDNSTGTIDRYSRAKELANSQMDVNELQEVVSDTSKGDKLSIFNERTIGRMIVDFKRKMVKIWLMRENDLGWIDYELDFIR